MLLPLLCLLPLAFVLVLVLLMLMALLLLLLLPLVLLMLMVPVMLLLLLLHQLLDHPKHVLGTNGDTDGSHASTTCVVCLISCVDGSSTDLVCSAGGSFFFLLVGDLHIFDPWVCVLTPFPLDALLCGLDLLCSTFCILVFVLEPHWHLAPKRPCQFCLHT